MIAPDLNSIPVSLTDLPRWLLWHEEPRAADGKPTKVPKTAANRFASSTNPKTWAAFSAIADAMRTAPENRFDGVGIVLGDLGNGWHVCGIDLDSCLDEQGNLAAWARPIVEALRTYLERSPGGRGLKSIFLARAEDAGELREMFGIDAGKWGNRRSVIGAANGEEHGPAIETYLGPGRLHCHRKAVGSVSRGRGDAEPRGATPHRRTGPRSNRHRKGAAAWPTGYQPQRRRLPPRCQAAS